MGTGFLVTSLIGASINPTTGDYSRGASGFWVEGGEIRYPVSGCTIAGNLRQMLRTLIPANDARPASQPCRPLAAGRRADPCRQLIWRFFPTAARDGRPDRAAATSGTPRKSGKRPKTPAR